MPDPLPCIPGHSFDVSTCACAAKCPGDLECLNGGKMSPFGCLCKCPGGWTGQACDLPADGTSKERAASSCRTIMEIFPKSADGVYWLTSPSASSSYSSSSTSTSSTSSSSSTSTSSTSFQVVCDMSTDGGGWTSVSAIGKELSSRELTTMDYTRGINDPGDGESAEFIMSCMKLRGLDGDGSTPLLRFILRVTMGSIRDYYRLDKQQMKSQKGVHDLCYLLTHRDGFEWSPNAGGMSTSLSARALAVLQTDAETPDDLWTIPKYNSGPKALGILGGSNETWPLDIDGRTYLSMWGSVEAPGGCCHYESKLYTKETDQEGQGVVDSGGWGKAFRMDIIELPEIQDSTDDPMEIVEEEEEVAAEEGMETKSNVISQKSNEERKNVLRSELSSDEQEHLVNQDAAAKEREKDFAGLDELFSDDK